jgi:hypothetical protein
MFRPVPNSFEPIQRMLDPNSTDMEGGNAVNVRGPGDNVGTITRSESAASLALRGVAK